MNNLQQMAQIAQGVLTNSPNNEEWLEALAHLSEGGEPLTPKQQEVATFLTLIARSSVMEGFRAEEELNELVELVKEVLGKHSQTLRSLMRNLDHRFNAEDVKEALMAIDADEEQVYLGKPGRGHVTTVYSLRQN